MFTLKNDFSVLCLLFCRREAFKCYTSITTGKYNPISKAHIEHNFQICNIPPISSLGKRYHISCQTLRLSLTFLLIFYILTVHQALSITFPTYFLNLTFLPSLTFGMASFSPPASHLANSYLFSMILLKYSLLSRYCVMFLLWSSDQTFFSDSPVPKDQVWRLEHGT